MVENAFLKFSERDLQKMVDNALISVNVVKSMVPRGQNHRRCSFPEKAHPLELTYVDKNLYIRYNVSIMTKYKIIQSSSISVFESEIEKALNDGWKLTNGNLILHATASGLVFWRELTKTEDCWPNHGLKVADSDMPH